MATRNDEVGAVDSEPPGEYPRAGHEPIEHERTEGVPATGDHTEQPQVEREDGAAGEAEPVGEIDAGARTERPAWQRDVNDFCDEVSRRTAPTVAELPPWREHPSNPHAERYVHDPERQEAVERAYRDGGLERAVVEINDVHEPGRTDNCADCTRAVAQTLDGRPTAADALDPHWRDEAMQPRSGEGVGESELWLERNFSRPAPATSGFAELGREGSTWPDGAHAMVVVHWRPLSEVYERETGDDWHKHLDDVQQSDGDEARRLLEKLDRDPGGHMFNIAVIDGETHIVDGQDGTLDPFSNEHTHVTRAATMRWRRVDHRRARR